MATSGISTRKRLRRHVFASGERRKLAATICSGVVAFMWFCASSAQELDEAVLEEVVVFAQKRSESLQDVPISVTAFTADDLVASAFNNIADLAQQVPNFIVSGAYRNTFPTFFLRGMGFNSFLSNDTQAVGIYLDEVLIEARGGQMFQMFDLERVEVLRGPQGTLYGRNTTGGAINFFTRKPGDRFEANGEVTGGRFGQLDFSGGVTIPVSDEFSVRVAGVRNNRDGNTRNEFTGGDVMGVDNWAARAIGRWAPSEATEWFVTVHGGNNDSDSAYYHYLEVEPDNVIIPYSESSDWWTLSANRPSYEKIRTLGASLHGTISLSGMKLDLIAAHNDVEATVFEDSDASPYDIVTYFNSTESKNYSAEVRLTSESDSRLQWLGGIYHSREELAGDLEVVLRFSTIFIPQLDAASELARSTQDSESTALFGQLSYALTDRLSGMVGVRWTEDSKEYAETVFVNDAGLAFGLAPDFVTGIGDNGTWDALSYRASLDFKVSPDAMLYGSYSRGYKSGQFTGLSFSDPLAFNSVDPEYVDAFEVGAKTTWLQNRLRTNVAAFFSDVQDLQQFIFFSPAPGQSIQTLRNAATAEIKGVEFELEARPAPGFDAKVGVAYLDAQFGTFLNCSTEGGSGDCTGNRMPKAPEWTMNAVAQYAIPVSNLPLFGAGAITPRVEFRWVDAQFMTESNTPIVHEPSYSVANASLTFSSEERRYELELWGRNITNEEYRMDSIDLSSVGAQINKHNDKASYGLTLRARFD